MHASVLPLVCLEIVSSIFWLLLSVLLQLFSSSRLIRFAIFNIMLIIVIAHAAPLSVCPICTKTQVILSCVPNA